MNNNYITFCLYKIRVGGLHFLLHEVLALGNFVYISFMGDPMAIQSSALLQVLDRYISM